jgi:hypothetical protein
MGMRRGCRHERQVMGARLWNLEFGVRELGFNGVGVFRTYQPG